MTGFVRLTNQKAIFGKPGLVEAGITCSVTGALVEQ